MEKNKNRTDLLAAGRKKLQQYRQKKDGKGSSSNVKSGKKSGKSVSQETDSDTNPTSEGLRQVLEDETSLVDSSLGNSDSLGNPVATTDDVPDVSRSPASSTHESENDRLLSGHRSEFSAPYVSDPDNEPDHTKSKQSAVEAIEESSITQVVMGIQDLEVESGSISAAVMAETDIRQKEGNKESLQSEGLSAVPLVLDGEPQVSDEAHGLDSRQPESNHGIDPKRDGEQNALAYGKFSGMVKQTVELDAYVEHTDMTPEQMNDDASAVSLRVEESNVLAKSVVTASGEDGTFTAGNESTNQEGFTIEASSIVHKSELLSESYNHSKEDDESDMEKSIEFVAKSTDESQDVESLRSTEHHPMSDVVITSSTNILQLLEAIKGLNEDDYELLIKSRGLASEVKLGTDTSTARPHGYNDWLEKLSGELFVASCSRDILHLQLSEQLDLQKNNDFQFSQLNEEMSRLKGALKDGHDKNANLVQDLIVCRSEFLDAVTNKEELQSQLQISKAEIDEVSARAYKLQNSLESSQSDLLSVSEELVHWKELVESLKVENTKLNEALAIGADERMKLKDQKECCLHENEELLKELDKFKNMTATLKTEISELSRTVVSLTNDKKKLEEENQWLADGNQKVSLELSNFKDSMDALKAENTDLNENLVSMKENHKNLEAENVNLMHEKEQLLSEFLGLRETLSNHQEEHMQLVAAMQVMEARLEQLTEYNTSLRSSLDVYEAKKGYVEEMQPQNLPLDGVAVVQGGAVMVERTDFVDVVNNEPSDSYSGTQDGGKQMSGDLAGCPPAEVFSHEAPDNTHGLVSFNAHLEEAERAFHNLEKAIELMRCHLASSSKSDGKVASPAVSKLIQAFETKSQHEEQETDDHDVMQDQSIEGDLFTSTKECTENLKAVMKQLSLDAEHASLDYTAAQDGLTTANATISDPKLQLETLAQHNDSSEMTNLEQKVLHEGLKQHLCVMEEKNTELEAVFEKLRQQNNSTKTENSELHVKMDLYKKRIEEIQGRLHELRNFSKEVGPEIHSQLKSFQKDIAEWALILEREWKPSFTQIVQAVERLDESVGAEQTSRLSAGKDGSLDITSWLASSVDAAVKMTWRLKEETEAGKVGQESTSKMLSEANRKCNELLLTNKAANDLLHELYSELKKLLSDLVLSVPDNETNIHNEESLDHIHYKSYEALLEQLKNSLEERQQLHAANKELSSELLNKTKEVEDLSRQSGDLRSIAKLVIDLEGVVKQDDARVDSEMNPVSRLESLVYFLTEKSKETDQLGFLSREQFGSKLEELHEKISQISSLKLEHENEIHILKEQLTQANEALNAVHSNLKEKTMELEQSEQRVSSVREKLSMAVAKGKGLIVQRDSLKQSLAETSNELDRCSQELQLKDARLYELETQLKNYSEAGERAEALESELSYIRNSATAIRESFLLKDSVLQKIEEILEDLDLPAHLHSRDIIVKVDWLARTVGGNSVSLSDWEQKQSAGDSPSDTGFAPLETWKEEVQMSSSSVDDLRRKCEELQGKFYGLAEQNEMLEQSLLERNQLVQRWEELLDVINLPSHLRSLEPEVKIEWIGNALLESNQDRNYLQQKVDNLESSCATLTADLEDSSKRITHLAADLEELQRKTSGLETNLQAVTHERDNLSEESAILARDNQQLLEKTVKFELDSKKLLNELTGLREKLVEKEGYEYQIQHINDEIVKLQVIVSNALQDSGATDLVGGDSGTEYLEGLLRKLIENYATHSAFISSKGIVTEQESSGTANSSIVEGRSSDRVITEHPDVTYLELDAVDARESRWVALSKELEEISSELGHVKEERDQYKNKQESLISEVEALDKKRMSLQELLIQEEQKSASAKEKLNIAVRKGKSLVQQRDSLKQTIEELNVELQHLKSEIKYRETTAENYEKKITDLSSTYSERIEALESESVFFRNRLASILSNINLGVEMESTSPVEKLEHIPRFYQDMQAALASSEQESAKSRRAAELLLAELNEVQERNDVLQEELSKVTFEFLELSNVRDRLEAAKFEAVSRIQELSRTYTEEKNKQYSELMVLISSTNQLRKIFSDVNNQVFGYISKDVAFTQNLEASVESLLQISEVNDVHQVPFSSNFSNDDTVFLDSVNKGNTLLVEPSSEASIPDHFDATAVIGGVRNSLQECMKEVVALKMSMQDLSLAKHEQVAKLYKHIHSFQKEMIHDKDLLDTLKSDVEHLESIVKQKETEAAVLQRNLFSLYETCISSLKEIGIRKAEIMDSTMVPRDLMDSGLMDGLPLSGKSHFLSEEHLKKMSDTLMMAVKDFISLKGEHFDGGRKEMKMTIASLQKELQEKDIQRERICMELVGQIKDAEAAATRSSLEFQSAKSRLQDLEKQVEVAMEERKLLEQQKSNELEDERRTALQLSDQIRLLSYTITAKEQEIEALTQALDEEESQMEDLTRKVEALEKALLQKNSDIENLEASRGKVQKKLSIIKSKFDELHLFSESLLGEIEKLRSQLNDRDADISFLRQEVTRCTNDVLVASQTVERKNVDEIHELFAWLVNLVPQFQIEANPVEDCPVHEYKEALQKKIAYVVSELENQRVAAQTKDTLLQTERNKVEDLSRREEILEKLLREKESQLNMLEGVEDVGGPISTSSEILEAEPMVNKWTVPAAASTSQVRSLRKLNNDQVAIAIDADEGGSRLEDEDDDKVHGFKSLTTSRIVPKFTRPVSDMIDGLWVSCDRTLMRQPAFRLGIMMYWAVMHLLLAAFIF